MTFGIWSLKKCTRVVYIDPLRSPRLRCSEWQTVDSAFIREFRPAAATRYVYNRWIARMQLSFVDEYAPIPVSSGRWSGRPRTRKYRWRRAGCRQTSRCCWRRWCCQEMVAQTYRWRRWSRTWRWPAAWRAPRTWRPRSGRRRTQLSAYSWSSAHL